MKQLIFIRHGSYDNDFRLNEEGRQQMEVLAQRLAPYLSEQPVRMLVSTAPRAMDSADILAERLGIKDRNDYPVLLCETTAECVAVLRLIQRKSEDVDALILVTHLECVDEVPQMFGLGVLQTEIPFRRLKKGQCRIISCEDGSSVFLP